MAVILFRTQSVNFLYLATEQGQIVMLFVFDDGG